MIIEAGTKEPAEFLAAASQIGKSLFCLFAACPSVLPLNLPNPVFCHSVYVIPYKTFMQRLSPTSYFCRNAVSMRRGPRDQHGESRGSQQEARLRFFVVKTGPPGFSSQSELHRSKPTFHSHLEELVAIDPWQFHKSSLGSWKDFRVCSARNVYDPALV